MTCLTAKGLTKKYGRKVAVDQVNLTLVTGEVVGLIGANGAGKTTLLMMLAGLPVLEWCISVMCRAFMGFGPHEGTSNGSREPRVRLDKRSGGWTVVGSQVMKTSQSRCCQGAIVNAWLGVTP
jgi:hypothetical protein